MQYLKHIEINIWKACNNKCLFCMSSNPHNWDIKFVDLETIKTKLFSYFSDWYRSVWFLGWDISIHPNIIEIISYCKEIWFIDINVISNAMRFSDYEFSKRLVESGITRINISVHSHLDEIEDLLTQVKWWLQKKLKAIDNFNSFYDNKLLRDAISINIVLNHKNYKTILETVLFFHKIKKINDIRINFIWLEEWVKNNWNDLKLTYSEFLPYLKKLVFLSIKYNIRITFDTVPACMFYKIDKENYKLLIKKFLWEDLDHIVEIDHINALDKFDWKKRKKDILKTQFESCKNCLYRESCQWVRKEYPLLFGESEFIPILN